MSASYITRVHILIHTMDMIKIGILSITILLKRYFGSINMYQWNFYVLRIKPNNAKDLILSSLQYLSKAPLGIMQEECSRIIINCS